MLTFTVDVNLKRWPKFYPKKRVFSRLHILMENSYVNQYVRLVFFYYGPCNIIKAPGNTYLRWLLSDFVFFL